MKKITLLLTFLIISISGYAQCDPVSSFTQDFESTADFAVPECWSAIIGGPGVSQYAHIETIGFNGTGQSRSVRINRDESGPDANVILVSPELSNLSAGTHRLRFSTFSNEVLFLEVGTLDVPNEDANFNLIGELVEVQTGVHEYTVDFTSYTESDVYVGIRVLTGYTVFIDDIVWEVAPLCPDVSGISITSTGTDTASIVWTAGGDEEEWDIVYGSNDVTDPQTLEPISPAPTLFPEGTLSELAPGTDYKVWVRSVCGDANGEWIGPATFTTDCLPTAVFNENFDTTAVDDLPACWSEIVRGPGSNTEYEGANVKNMNPNSGENSVQLNRFSENSEVFLVGPNLSTLPLGTHRIKFYGFSYNENPSLEFGTLSSNENDADFNPIDIITVTDTYTEFIVDYTVYEGTDTYIGIKLHTGIAIFLDDIRWEMAPACADVSGFETTVTTPNSAAFSWTAGGNETSWDVVYGATTVTDPTTLTPITPAPTGQPTATVSGLENITTYNAWVRSSCSDEEKGAWIGPITFSTACLPVADLNENFDASEPSTLPDCWSKIIRGEDTPDFANVEAVNFSFNSEPTAVRIQSTPLEGEDVDSDVILVSPNLSTLQTGNYRLKFFSISSDPGVLEIGTLNAAASGALFSPFEDVTVSNSLTEHTVSFANYSGTDTYIGLRHKTGHAIYVDDIRWEITPLCDDVQSIAVSEIGTGDATVNWTAGGSENNWQVAYGFATVTDPETLTPGDLLTETTALLSELADNTDYKVWVRSVCGGSNGNGAWIGPVTFRTECLATDVPYTEDFESTDGPELPACTFNFNAGEGSDWEVEDNALTYSYDSDEDADAWFFTRGINLVAGTEYTLSYDYGNNSSYVEKLMVYYGSSKDVEGMTDFLADHPEITDEAEESNELTFVPTTSGIYYFGFNAYSEADQNQLFVDNISISATLGNDDFRIESFKFSPNPVKDILNVSYKQNISDVVVYNLLGQKVLESTVNATSTQVDMSGLASGSYLVKVSSESHTQTIKILKQ